MEWHAVHRRRGGRGCVPHVLEGGIGLKVVAHDSMFGWSVRVPRRRRHQLLTVFVLVIHVFLAHEVLGTLVLVCAAILYSVSVVLPTL
jgi:hypothetical protein